MSRVLLKTCILLAVTTHARAQYFDIFNSFLQPPTTSRPRNVVTKRPDTKHRQTNKQKYQDAIFFEDDLFKARENIRIVDPFNIHPTTTKPRRKPKTTTSHNIITITTIKPKTANSNKINNNPEVIKIVNNDRNNPEVIQIINNDRNNVDRSRNNGRRIDYDLYNNNFYKETTKPPYEQYYRIPTQKTTSFYNTKTTARPNRYEQKNPLLNRPGVKPAVIDENRPPITNRPITERPVERPFQSQTSRPREQYRPPVNTRPPFETERPISTGVAYPIPKGNSNEDTEIDIEIGPDEDEMSDAEKRRLYDMCEQKCTEYKSMQMKRVVALPLSGGGGGAEVNVSSCAPATAPLVLGGQLAKIETFPHMALLGWKLVQSDGYAWKCGGSLVSEQFVLTAGHCTYHDKDYNVVSGPPAAVQLGSSIYNDRTATVAKVTLVVRHPKYKLRRSYYDVALLKLAVKLTFSETIRPACLGVPPDVGEPVIATGWGKTEFGGDSSIQLRSVSIPIWDMGDCQEIWGTSLKLPDGPMPDNQVCAGEKKGAKDTCQGDSGGPAQVRDGCAWRVVAVTSVGRSCGAPDTPALYARVPRAFVASQAYTNTKSERDGNNQYGNEGVNVNNNNRNNNNGNIWNNRNDNNNGNSWNTRNENNNGNSWNTRNKNNNENGNNWSTTTENSGNVNNWNIRTDNNNGNSWSNRNDNNNGNANNWNTRYDNNGNGNNWNGNNAAGNHKATVTNQNRNTGVTTKPVQNNNNYYNPIIQSNNQFGSSQSSSSNNRGMVNNNAANSNLNNRYDSWTDNNRNNQNGNIYDYNNAQTTNGYNQNFQNGYSNPGQSYYTENVRYPTEMMNYGYNKNVNVNNGYNVNPMSNRQWWM